MIEQPFIETLRQSIIQNWDRPAFTDYGTDVTMRYEDVAVQIEKLHILFREMGIVKNDKIALSGKNNCHWVTSYLAIITYGAIVVPILQDFNTNDALHIINHSESRLLIISEILYEGLDMAQMEQVEAVISLSDFSILASRAHLDKTRTSLDAIEVAYQQKYPQGLHPSDLRYSNKSNAEIASINYTSGTTGFSKGVITSLNGLAGNVLFCSSHHVVYHESRQVVFLPLAHAFGCAFDFLTTFATGAHAWFIGRTPSPRILLQAMAEIKPTCVFTVPLIIEKIYKTQILPLLTKSSVNWALKMPLIDDMLLGKLRQQLVDAFGGNFDEIIIGGAPLNAEVDAFLNRIQFPYTTGYGMTECAPLISYCKSKDYRMQSCGKALPNIMEVRIADANEAGIGEIQVRGENVMLGYYKNEEATRSAFTADGWLKTGDLGIVDEDGYIYIKGRNNTTIVGASGQNIYPEEIEAKLNNMPYVMESLVMKHSDGSLVALVCPDFVSVDADHLSNEMLAAAMETNRRNLNAQLAHYEQIARLTLYPHEFEKTPKKSIKRYLYTQL